MMEKSAEYQYMVYKQEGKLLLRLPGGEVIPYDNRFSDLPYIDEGGHWIKTILEE